MSRIHGLILVLIAVMVVGVVSSNAVQPPNLNWQYVINSDGIDWANSVVPCSDGSGYVVLRHVAGSIVMTKLDNEGQLMWSTGDGIAFDGDAYVSHGVEYGTNGLIVTGWVSNDTGLHMYPARFAIHGIFVWRLPINDTDENVIGRYVQVLPNGNIVVVGTRTSNDPNSGIYVMMTDPQGSILWDQSYSGYFGNCVRVSPAGTLLVVGEGDGGFGSSDGVLLELDVDGVELNRWYFGDGSFDHLYSLVVNNQGDVVMAGSTSGNNGSKAWLFQFNLFVQQVIWEQVYEDLPVDEAFTVARVEDGYVISAVNWVGVNNTTLLIRTNMEGAVEWSKTLHFLENSSTGDSFQPTNDGGFITIGNQPVDPDWPNDYQVRVMKWSAELPDVAVRLVPHVQNIQVPSNGGSFNFNVELTNNDPDETHAVDVWTAVSLQNGYELPIFTREAVELEPNEQLVRSNLQQMVPGSVQAGLYTYFVYVMDHASWEGVSHDKVGFQKVEGLVQGGGHQGDWLLAGWDENEVVDGSVPTEFAIANIYPNPFNPTTNVAISLPQAGQLTVAVYDLLGREVANLASGQFTAGSHQFILDGTNLASGQYFVRGSSAGTEQVQRITLVK